MSDVAASYRAGAEWFWEVGHREAPLSGEFSGESVPEITERFGLVRLDEDAFEEGFFESAAAFPEYGAGAMTCSSLWCMAAAFPEYGGVL